MLTIFNYLIFKSFWFYIRITQNVVLAALNQIFIIYLEIISLTDFTE